MTQETQYTDKIGKKICERIVEGKSLRDIEKMDGMPAKSTILKWLANEVSKSFMDQYKEARDLQADIEFEEIKEITDAEPNFYVDEKGNKRVDTGWVQLQRLKADKRQWRAAKLKPKKYGDKIENVISNKEGETFKTSSMTDKELNARLAEFTALNKKK